LIAASLASQPELQKNALSAPLYRRELVRERFLLADTVQVGGVDQARALLRDRPRQFRVTMAERVDRDPASASRYFLPDSSHTHTRSPRVKATGIRLYVFIE